MKAPPTGAVQLTSEDLVGSFLAGKKATTIKAYRKDLQDFARFIGARDIDEATRSLLAGGHGSANLTAHKYRADMIDRGLSPATINRRLAALSSLVKLSRTMGMVPWSLDVPRMKAAAYRDTAGPGEEGVDLILSEIDRREKYAHVKARRDRALVLLMFDLGLRRGEIAALDLEDFDREAGAVSILGKGRHQVEPLTLTSAARLALDSWLEVRGADPGPLFFNLRRSGSLGSRISGRGIHKVVGDLGDAVGIKNLRPHGFRHSAITALLDSGAGVRDVMKFSRHLDPRTVMKYDDNRHDVAGDLAETLAARRDSRRGGSDN